RLVTANYAWIMFPNHQLSTINLTSTSTPGPFRIAVARLVAAAICFVQRRRISLRAWFVPAYHHNPLRAVEDFKALVARVYPVGSWSIINHRVRMVGNVAGMSICPEPEFKAEDSPASAVVHLSGAFSGGFQLS